MTSVYMPIQLFASISVNSGFSNIQLHASIRKSNTGSTKNSVLYKLLKVLMQMAKMPSN